MTLIVKNNGQRKLEFSPERLRKSLEETIGTLELEGVDKYIQKAIRFVESKDEVTADHLVDHLIREAESTMTVTETQWEKVAARLYLKRLYKRAAKNRFYDAELRYGSYVGLLESLGEEGVYSQSLFYKYTKEELTEAGKLIRPERDELFTYNGLYLLASRYLATDNSRHVYELPQERWLTIALYLMQDEKPRDHRMQLVAEAYWAMSTLRMTVATPTLANAGKTNAQLSSCFVETVDDSLQGIYDSNTDIARVSKHGGGVGAYLGHIRATGSSIRGVAGSSGGVIPWIKQLNNTAVSVDQLGQRKGAINVTLDVFHKDIEKFLDLRLNNGDQRMRAHDIFLTVSIPDLFMETLQSRGVWYLFDPHEVRTKKGWALEDFYDEFKGQGEFRKRYEMLVADDTISRTAVKSVDILKRILTSQLEAGMPFMFYRDTVNRANPNKHAGMIYSSNLCMEICQNMSPTEFLQEVVSGDQVIITKRSGDFVVCNLSSVNLGALDGIDDKELERLIAIEVRMLDNVIDLNNLPVPQATITNQKYRAIGLGTFGWHHYLAKQGVMWESDEAVEITDRLYERINYLAIKASCDLAKEKGQYPLFQGSDWSTGRYFSTRKYTSDAWTMLQADVKAHGLRNGYLMAVAPNMSTAQIAGSSASIDPVYSAFYYEEKKDYRRPVVAPDLSVDTYAYYEKSSFLLDQFASIRQNIARQRHVDQAISFNLYIPSAIRATVLRDLHFACWEGGVKTTYYTRSNDMAVEECAWCSS